MDWVGIFPDPPNCPSNADFGVRGAYPGNRDPITHKVQSVASRG